MVAKASWAVALHKEFQNKMRRFSFEYEYLTASRYGKRATLSALLPAPQDPTEDASMTESFVLTLYFNTLHVRFHVDGLEGHQQHH
jgi:hypothetical protein